jgi:hypothetical protein
MGEMMVKALEYPDYVEQLRATDTALAGQLASLHGIEEVLTWMQQHNLGRAAVDIVAQDEFEYDFLVEAEPGGKWLSFGVT